MLISLLYVKQQHSICVVSCGVNNHPHRHNLTIGVTNRKSIENSVNTCTYSIFSTIFHSAGILRYFARTPQECPKTYLSKETQLPSRDVRCDISGGIFSGIIKAAVSSVCFVSISGLGRIKFGLQDLDLCNALNFLRRQRNIRHAIPPVPRGAPPPAPYVAAAAVAATGPSVKWSAGICIAALEPSGPANCCRINDSINTPYLSSTTTVFCSNARISQVCLFRISQHRVETTKNFGNN